MRIITILLAMFVMAATSCPGLTYPYSAAKSYYAGDSGIRWVRTGDINNDNIVDLIVLSDSDTSKIGVLLGIGNGEFMPYSELPLDLSGHDSRIDSWLVFDYPPHDGFDDIITSSSDAMVIHKNNGDGTWDTEQKNWWISNFIGSNDCDSDGELDIFVFVIFNFQMYIGIISPPNPISFVAGLPNWSWYFPPGDFNNDGHLDIITTEHMDASEGTIYFGFEHCTYFDPAIQIGHQLIGDLYGMCYIQVGDFNNDGYDDIVYRPLDDGRSCYIVILYGGEDGVVYDNQYQWTPDCDGSLFLVDAEGDGHDDIGIVDTRFVGANHLPLYIHFNGPDAFDARCDTLILTTTQRSQLYASELSGDIYEDLYYFPSLDSIGVVINLGPVATTLLSSSMRFSDDGNVHIDWAISNGNDDISYYQVGRTIAGSSDELISSVDHNAGQAEYSYSEDVSGFRGKTLEYRVVAVDRSGDSQLLFQDELVVPRASTRLLPNYPNPFNPGTRIAFELTDPCVVSLEIYDVSGRRVAKLIDGREYPQGRHQIDWNGTGANALPLASGVYYCRLKAGKEILTQKMLLLK